MLLYRPTFFPSAIWLWNTLSATSWQFQDPSQQFPFHLSIGLHLVFIVCTALCFYEVAFHCLLHGFLDTLVLIHSWCDVARNWVSTVIWRWRWMATTIEPLMITGVVLQASCHCCFPTDSIRALKGKGTELGDVSQIVSDYGLILTVSVQYSVFFFWCWSYLHLMVWLLWRWKLLT